MARYSSIKSEQLEQLVALRDKLLAENVPRKEGASRKQKSERRQNNRPGRAPAQVAHRIDRTTPTAPPSARPSQANHKGGYSRAEERAELKAGLTAHLGTVQLVRTAVSVSTGAARTGVCWAKPLTKGMRRYFNTWQLCRVSSPSGRWWILEIHVVYKAHLRGPESTQVHWREIWRSHPELADAFSDKWMTGPLEFSISATRHKQRLGQPAKQRQLSSPQIDAPNKPGKKAGYSKVRARIVHTAVGVESRSDGGSSLVPSGSGYRSTPASTRPLVYGAPRNATLSPSAGLDNTELEICPRCRGELPDCLSPDCNNGWVRVRKGTQVQAAIRMSPVPQARAGGPYPTGVRMEGSSNSGPQVADHEAVGHADPNASKTLAGTVYRDGGQFGSMPLHDDYDS